MKKIFMIIVTFCLVFIPYINVYANSDLIDQGLASYNFNEMDSVLKNEAQFDLSFEELVREVITGNLDLNFKSIYKYVENSFNEQYKTMAILFFDIFMIGISSAFIQNLTSSVKPKTTTAIGNYVCYIALIHILTTSLIDVMSIVTSFLNFIENFTFAAMPIVLGSLVFSGYIGTSYVVQTLLVGLTYIISYLFQTILVQFIFVIAIIEIVNGVTDKELLSNFCDIGNKIIKWTLRSVTIAYISVLSLIKIGAPISDNLIKRGARTAVSALPVVGSTLTSAVDTISIVADVTSNALLFVLVLFCLIYGLTYLISLLFYNVLFTLSAVLIEPVASKNIVKSLKNITKYIGYFMGMFGIAMFLFIFSVIMIMS